MSSNARFEVFPMVLPEMGPRSVPDKISFVANQVEELDLTQLIDNGWLDYISGVYVDNFGNSGTITLVCSGTNQRFIIAPDTAGYYPLLLPNSPKVMLTNTASEIVTFQWYNIPVFPIVVKGNVAADSNVNIAEVGGVPIIGAIPVALAGPTITDYSAALTGGDDELIALGEAAHYLLIVNPTGNATITVNLAGGDASVSGFEILAGGNYECVNGVANAVHISGTAADTVTVFAG